VTALVRTRAELAEVLAPARRAGARVGFVPTMGALHEGHLSLVRRARALVGPEGPVVVSVFVNPLQFGEAADLERYPRTLDADLALCAAEGVDAVFAPAVEEVYPGGAPQVTVHPGPLAEVLEGASRPGHFAGVLTVVAKLFGLVRPDVAVFGEKDYQQLALVRRMVDDLCLGVEVVGGETCRDDDGLAMSSRNRFLDGDERRAALALSRALRAAGEAAPAGSVGQGVDAARGAALAVLAAEPGVDLDHLALTTTDLRDLTDPAVAAGVAPGTEGRALVAARVGAVRLIDNLPIVVGSPATPTASPTPTATATIEQGAS